MNGRKPDFLILDDVREHVHDFHVPGETVKVHLAPSYVTDYPRVVIQPSSEPGHVDIIGPSVTKMPASAFYDFRAPEAGRAVVVKVTVNEPAARTTDARNRGTRRADAAKERQRSRR